MPILAHGNFKSAVFDSLLTEDLWFTYCRCSNILTNWLFHVFELSILYETNTVFRCIEVLSSSTNTLKTDLSDISWYCTVCENYTLNFVYSENT